MTSKISNNTLARQAYDRKRVFAYCNSCGKRFKSDFLEHSCARIRRGKDEFALEIMTGKQWWNGHDLCPTCVIKVLEGAVVQPNIIYPTKRVFTTNLTFLHEQEVTRRLLTDELDDNDIDPYLRY